MSNRKQRRALAAHGLAESIPVPVPPEGELVLFVSDGTRGGHAFILADASEEARIMVAMGLIEKVLALAPKEQK